MKAANDLAAFDRQRDVLAGNDCASICGRLRHKHLSALDVDCIRPVLFVVRVDGHGLKIGLVRVGLDRPAHKRQRRCTIPIKANRVWIRAALVAIRDLTRLFRARILDRHIRPTAKEERP